MSERPKWHHKIPEATARWFWAANVVRIEHGWEFTSPDTSRSWLLLTRSDGVSAEFPSAILEMYGRDLEFSPYHAGLVRLQLEIGETLASIDKWEKAGHRERLEYERLKRKFEGT